ncbi:hypothetical protein ACFQ48_04375 [Hymenobacter caeli]|uniref:STAS/SEC14 domain-containing protein n=1 Tax=Hymenobacter caeli TaxID=2735894 RepID=A0ABX2FRU1_9BACT|nr:hypothetical protein [Hymenobacter caeli]NRT19194.1 hypothetical protein [Hymenobacter caeli]
MSLLRVSWAAGRDMSRFRSTFERVLEVARRVAASRVVLELDALPDISPYDQAWLATQWMPRAVELPLEQVVIVLSPRRIYNHQVVEGLLFMARPFIHFDVQFFSQSIPALRWISDYSPLVPGLLAEWDAAFGPAGLAPGTGNAAEQRASYGYDQA